MHYLVSALTVAVAAIVIVALVQCARTPGLRICDGHDPEGNVFQLRAPGSS